MGRKRFDWTAEAKEKLRRWWEEGYSCSQIAQKLAPNGELSTNSIAGKVNRLKLPMRKGAHSTNASRAVMVRQSRPISLAKPSVKPEPPAEPKRRVPIYPRPQSSPSRAPSLPPIGFPAVVQPLLGIYTPEELFKWLYTPHKLLEGKMPRALISAGQSDKVAVVVDQLVSGAFV